MLKKFSAVKNMDKTFTLIDFKKYTLHSISASFLDGVKSGKSLKKIQLKLPSIAERIFKFNGDVFAFCQDKRIYKTDEKTYKSLGCTIFTSPSDVFSIGQGKDKIIYVKDGEHLYFFGRTLGVISCDKNAKIKYVDGRLFYINDHQINFNKTPIFSCLVHKKSPDEFFMADKKFGKILGVYKYADGIIALCEKCAYFLSLGYDYTEIKVDKIIKFKDKVVYNSVAETKDGIIFVIGDKICLLKDKSLAEKGEIKDEFILTEKAQIQGEYYLLPVIKLGERLTYIFSLESSDCQYVKSVDEPYYLFDDNGEKFYLKTLPLDFGLHKEKVLTTLFVKTVSPIKVSILGDGGRGTFIADQSQNSLITGIRSKTFTVEIEGNGSPVKIDEIKFYFKD